MFNAKGFDRVGTPLEQEEVEFDQIITTAILHAAEDEGEQGSLSEFFDSKTREEVDEDDVVFRRSEELVMDDGHSNQTTHVLHGFFLGLQDMIWI